MSTKLKQMRSDLDVALMQHKVAVASLLREQASLEASKQELTDALAAQTFLQDAAAAIQESVHRQIAGVVTRCLKTVFGVGCYEFRISFEKRRGKTEAEMSFVRDGQEVDPLEAAGGGAVDVASFALRLACLLLTRPQRRKLLVMDEPFRFVNGAEYQERAAQLLETLAEELDFQFVIVTDDEWLKLGTVVEL